MAYQTTGIHILNLDECIKSVVDMSKISDSVEGRVVIDTEEPAEGPWDSDVNTMYFIYQEFGFSVKTEGGQLKYTYGGAYMERAFTEKEELIKQDVIKYLKSRKTAKEGIQMYPFIKKWTEITRDRAEELAPEDTGRLKASIRAETKVKE